MKIWLDDVRPAPDGWIHVKTVDEAIKYLLTGQVDYISLDNDLGHAKNACDDCQYHHDNCDCDCHALNPEGYTLVDWMEANNIWPRYKPLVHTDNPYRAEYMNGVIRYYFGWR